MTQRPKAHYLTVLYRGKQVTLSIVWARNELDAAAITGRAEGVDAEAVDVTELDGKLAHDKLRLWFRRSYVRALQGDGADHLASWRFETTDLQET